ncbi:MAG: type II/IV secretion system ATPase subunit [Methanophagales archaeon]|nr:type II/IV secretion system ATPase subunit [Methanophagales archaeon]
MPKIELPFNAIEVNGHEDSDLTQCGLYRLLSAEGKEYVEKSKHVLHYLHMLPIEEVGTPEFYPSLSRKMKEIKNPNLIYPLNDDIAVHILADREGSRNFYIPIEPVLANNFDDLIEKVEMRIVNLVDMFKEPKNDEEKKAILGKCIDLVCEPKTEPNGGNGRRNNNNYRKLRNLLLKSRNDHKLRITPYELKAIKYMMVRDKVGLGILEPFLHDPYIEDISCSGVGQIFIEHKIFEALWSPISFENTKDLDVFVMTLSEKIGKPVSYRNPIVDAVLPDGSRINIVFGEEISKKGSNFTIRKFSETPLSVLQLIEFGTLDYVMAAYLWIALHEGMNCFIAGETASGKTTTMNALTTFIPANAKIVSIEDTPELQVPHKNWLREVIRTAEGKKESENAGVGMFDLLKAALRQRPNEIIIGEIRGVEGNIAFQAMQTGHSAMSTFHAASVEKLIQRLTGDPINVPRTNIDNLNLIVIQNAVRGKDGELLRRITSVNEIVKYDPVDNSFLFVEVFRWNPVSDTFEFVGNMNSYLLEEKIAFKRRIPENMKIKIYKEIEKRARILQKVHKSGVTNFYDLFAMLSKIEREGIAV